MGTPGEGYYIEVLIGSPPQKVHSSHTLQTYYEQSETLHVQSPITK